MNLQIFDDKDIVKANKYIADNIYDIPENGILHFDDKTKILVNKKNGHTAIIRAMRQFYYDTMAKKIATQNKRRELTAFQIKYPKGEVNVPMADGSTISKNVEWVLRDNDEQLKEMEQQLRFTKESIEAIKKGDYDKELDV